MQTEAYKNDAINICFTTLRWLKPVSVQIMINRDGIKEQSVINGDVYTMMRKIHTLQPSSKFVLLQSWTRCWQKCLHVDFTLSLPMATSLSALFASSSRATSRNADTEKGPARGLESHVPPHLQGSWESLPLARSYLHGICSEGVR